MELKHFPDPGAEVRVTVRGGAVFSGRIDAGHSWASDLLCLCDRDAESVERGAGALFFYVDPAEVVAFTWDCRS